MRYEDARVGETAFPIYFTTHAQTGAMVAPSSAFEIADVVVYKDGSATQRTSTAGMTMTSPFDTITGLHQVLIDLTDNTDAGFWAVGSRYTVSLQADETVDGLSVSGTIISRFRILPAETVAGTPKADVSHWLGTAAATPTVGGVPEVDVTHWIGTAAATPTVAGVPEVDVTHWIGTAAATPTVAGVPEVDLTHVAGSAVSAASAQLGVNVVNFGGSAGTFAGGRPEVNTSHFGGTAGTFAAGRAEVNTSHIAGSAVSTTSAQIGVNVVQLSTDAVAADNAEAFFDGTGYAGTGNVIPSVTTVTGNVNGSVGSVTGAVGSVTGSVGSVVGAVGSVTGAVGSVTGAVGSVTGTVGSVAAGGITAASFGAAAIDAASLAPDAGTEIGTAVWASVIRTLTSGAPSSGEIADAVWDEATAGHTTGGTFGEQAKTDIDTIVTNTTSLPTAAGIADSVWDEALSGHLSAGSTGKALSDGSTSTLTATDRQNIADTILLRSLANARASGVGDNDMVRSLLGALSKLVNKVNTDAPRDNLRIYEENDTTIAYTQPIETSPGADPIKSVGGGVDV